jgi:leucyl aminopeptidase
VTTWAGLALTRRAGTGRVPLLVAIMLLVALLTAVVSPNGSVAALLPMVVVVALRNGHAVPQMLAPLAFGAHAGSLLALSGSPVNVIVSDAAVQAGVDAAAVTARAALVARDLTNTPPGHLTAPDLADAAVALGSAHGFDVEVFDQARLVEMGCGGLLAVNRGSAEEARLVRLTYEPPGEPTGHLAFVGKGIMYDSGGISLKPSDPMHLLMKMDMGGAAAILGAFTARRDLGVRCRVTGFLACTDDVPSGSAYVLADVLHTRGGRTVEVRNTDAESRLAMCDALVLATEGAPSAVVTIATLTGAALAALGQRMAAVLGNDQGTVDRVRAAAARTDERVWQLPLERGYRKQLDSDVADVANLGGPYAGTITAALFLAEFVGDVPWAHLDICPTMQSSADEGWRPKGATGDGARLLAELARGFDAAADPPAVPAAGAGGRA